MGMHAGAESIDRRRQPRVKVDMRVVELDGNATYFQYASDLSVGGMFLHGTAPHDVGNQVTVVFKLPGQELVNLVPAEVVGNTGGAHRGTHLKFIDGDDSADALAIAICHAHHRQTIPLLVSA